MSRASGPISSNEAVAGNETLGYTELGFRGFKD